jgi:hypothetical protein
MKSGLSVVLALGVVALAAAPSGAQFRGARGGDEMAKNGWFTSLEEGKALARKSGKPLMVVLRCVP